MEIEVSAFGNFSTDTGSMDCNQVCSDFGGVDRQSRTGLIFIIIIIIKAFEMWIWKRIERISNIDKVTNEDILRKAN